MDAITFRAEVNGEQVIRPPASIVLPEGPMEVTVRPVVNSPKTVSSSRDEANAWLRQSRVDIGHATGIDNNQIDADLAGEYAGESKTPSHETPR